MRLDRGGRAGPAARGAHEARGLAARARVSADVETAAGPRTDRDAAARDALTAWQRVASSAPERQQAGGEREVGKMGKGGKSGGV